MQPRDTQYASNDQPTSTPQVFGPQTSPNVATATPGYAAPDLSAPAQPTVNGGVSVNHPRGFMQTSVKVLAVLVVLGGLAGVGYGLNAKYSKDHATATAKSFISSLNDGNMSAAYKSTTSNLRSIQTEAQFKSNLGDLTAKKPVASHQSLQVAGKDAVYKVTVNGLPETDFGRTDGIFTVALVKHGLNSWQVDGVQVQ